VRDENNEVVKDTTDWSEPVGPLYDSKNAFEYLKSPAQSTDCEALFSDEQKEDGTYKNTAKYRACMYYQPIENTVCRE
jgi:hypothetical protein